MYKYTVTSSKNNNLTSYHALAVCTVSHDKIGSNDKKWWGPNHNSHHLSKVTDGIWGLYDNTDTAVTVNMSEKGLTTTKSTH